MQQLKKPLLRSWLLDMKLVDEDDLTGSYLKICEYYKVTPDPAVTATLLTNNTHFQPSPMTDAGLLTACMILAYATHVRSFKLVVAPYSYDLIYYHPHLANNCNFLLLSHALSINKNIKEINLKRSNLTTTGLQCVAQVHFIQSSIHTYVYIFTLML